MWNMWLADKGLMLGVMGTQFILWRQSNFQIQNKMTGPVCHFYFVMCTYALHFRGVLVGVLTYASTISQNPPLPVHQMNRCSKTWSTNVMGSMAVTCQMLVCKVPCHTAYLRGAVEAITCLGRDLALFLDREAAAPRSKRSPWCDSRWKGPSSAQPQPFLVCPSSLTTGLPSALATT